jgi:hypothetical protein
MCFFENKRKILFELVKNIFNKKKTLFPDQIFSSLVKCAPINISLLFY